MKAVRSRRIDEDCIYDGPEKPKHKIGDYLRVYCGRYQDHCFYVKDIRYNYDIGKFEYLYNGMLMGGWYAEGSVVREG